MKIARTGVGAVGMAEAGTVGMAETGAVDAAGGVAVGIVMFVTTSGSSKVFAIRRTCIQSKGRLHQLCRYVYKMVKKEGGGAMIKKKGGEGGRLHKIGEIHTYELGLIVTTLLLIRIKNLLLHGGFVIKILKNLIRSLKGQVYIRPTFSRVRDGIRGNHQKGAILHGLR